jgi:N-acetylglucosamine kinase-like BadF-type ATPase
LTRYYLGIDGGQSSTTALIADDTGRILGFGRSGPCNHMSEAEAAEKFTNVIRGCLQDACEQAGLDTRTVSFASACFGFSGGPEDKETYSRQLIRSARYKLTHDAEVALAGATAGQPGIIVIAGTGSMAFGKNEHGITARAGGWGYIFGDEGGAFDIVRRALRASLQFEEGWGPRTSVRELLLGATDAASADSLMRRFYTPEFPRSKVASLAGLTTEAAESGDQVALDILMTSAHKLAWFVQGVHRNLFPNGVSVSVSYTGGVFRSVPLRAEFSKQVREMTGCRVQAPLFGPAAGAVLEALRLDGNQSSLQDVPEIEK